MKLETQEGKNGYPELIIIAESMPEFDELHEKIICNSDWHGDECVTWDKLQMTFTISVHCSKRHPND